MSAPAAPAPQSPSFFDAVRVGDVDRVRASIAAGANLDARNDEGRTALHDAIEHGQTEIRDLLLAAGATVDICAAAILGDLPRVRELLDEVLERVDDRTTGLTPLGWAAFGNQVEVGRVLLDHLLDRGADLDEIHPESGGNALHAAVCMRYTCDAKAFVRMLLAAGMDPCCPTAEGKTALQLAEEGSRAQTQAGGATDPDGLVRDFEGVAELLRQAAPAGC